jgi:hypothetical protein
VGGFIDVVEDGRTGYLVEPGSAPELARVLERITRQELQAMRPHIDAAKVRMSWDALVDALLELIE